MSVGLFIDVGSWTAFAPDISGCNVLVTLSDAYASGTIEITMHPSITASQIASVLNALQCFFEGEQYRTIDFDNRKMLVQHLGTTGQVSLVPASDGFLRDDGIVEFKYPPPHK